MNKYLRFFVILIALTAVMSVLVYAAPTPEITVTAGVTEDPRQTAASIQLLFLVSIIALAPTLIMMVTCFPRVIIALHFLRSAMATQQMPPNQVLIALALFITLALMGPTFSKINNDAIKPFADGTISQEEALVKGMAPLREFMFKNVQDKDLALFWEISGKDKFESYDDIPNQVLIPAFLLGEVSNGFKIGVYIYIPFIVIDMVVASILMAMGMMMLPPAMISMPFKILLFVSVDGWNLFVKAVIAGFG
ncbi:MAG: flagellar type III secretion system pore protein FliP [Clostridiales bacterium]|jgi:flagellar biosynthetic protein FliP|nr:flagellar type III secretion system pore protein FliP [Clostridiales bacterium]